MNIKVSSINLFRNDNGNKVVVCNIVLDGLIVINNVELLKNGKNYVLKFPECKKPVYSKCQACHPIDNTFRKELTQACVQAYNKLIEG